MPTTIITDGEQRSALAIARSLGRAGHRCVILSASGFSLAGASHHAQRDHAVPSPGNQPEAFVAAVRDITIAERADLVIPVTEEALLAILSSRDEIPAVIPFPDLATFTRVCSKADVLEAACALGIRVPVQYEIRSRQEAVSLPPPPLVLKPARSVYTAPDGTRSRTTVRWAYTLADVAANLAAYDDAMYPILAQEVIEGPGIGMFLFVHEGDVLARFAHRRIYEKPPTGGVSVLSESEPMDEDLYARSVALLQKLNWSGVAMVEYKKDANTGEYVLMEINGRFWGSLQLAIDAGVDFPRIVADVALGRRAAPVLSYGIARNRWEWGHVDHLIARLRAPGATHRDRARAFLEWIRAFHPRNRNEVLRYSDPQPFWRESMQWIRHVAGR